MKKMKRICCFTDCLGSGGAQRQLVGLACLLKERGYDVTMLVYYDIPFYKSQLDEAEVPYVVVGNTRNPIKRIWNLYKYWKAHPAEVVIAYQETPSVIACLLRPLLHWTKLIVSERNTTQHITLKDKVRFALWRFADFIVPNSHAQTDFIKANQPRYIDKVFTITNFTDTDYFVPAKCRDMVHPNNVIAVVASAKPEKNFHRFVQAVELIKKRGYKIRVRWCGINPPMLAEFKSYVQGLNMSDCVDVLPSQKDVATVLQNADFFSLPSLFEGFPNALCEAMSCGLPVACSRVCDNPILVADGENGFLFSPDNVADIADAMCRLLDLSEEQYKTMSSKNREKAVSILSKQKFVDQYTLIIE